MQLSEMHFSEEASRKLSQMKGWHNTLRISVGRFNTDGEVETAVDRIIATVQELKMLSESALSGTG